MKLLDSLEYLILEQTQSPILSYDRFLEPKIDESCKSKWQTELPKAVEYWKNWLSNPITKEKFKKNWNVDPKTNTVKGQNVDEIFKKYISILDKMKLVFYNNETKFFKELGRALSPGHKNMGAFVPLSNPDLIFVNCSYDWSEKYATLVHEIQHTLYQIFPLNPDTKVQSLFGKTLPIPQNRKQYGFPFSSNKNISKTAASAPIPLNLMSKLSEISIQYKIPIEALQIWNEKALFEKEKNPDPGYACRETEKLSNISAIRKIFNIQPGQNITFDMLKPYIELKKQDTDVYWLLICWAMNGFNNFETLLKNLNDLAFQKNTKSDIQSV